MELRNKRKKTKLDRTSTPATSRNTSQTSIDREPTVRPRGEPKLTWLCLVTSELSRVGIDLNDINQATAQDQYAWKTLVGHAMSLDE